MAELKTKPTRQNVAAFLRGVEDDTKREGCRILVKIMKRATGAAPKMWGASMVGFGRYHYKYRSGHEGDWFLTGFSPRKRDLTVYIMSGFTRYSALLRKLGKHKTAKSCLYLKRLTDVDLKVLEELIRKSVKQMKKPGGGLE